MRVWSCSIAMLAGDGGAVHVEIGYGGPTLDTSVILTDCNMSGNAASSGVYSMSKLSDTPADTVALTTHTDTIHTRMLIHCAATYDINAWHDWGSWHMCSACSVCLELRVALKL